MRSQTWKESWSKTVLTLPRRKGTLRPSLLKDAPLKQRRMSDKLTFCTASPARADQPLLDAALPYLLTDQPPSCLTCSNHWTSPQRVSDSLPSSSALCPASFAHSHLFAVHLFCSLFSLTCLLSTSSPAVHLFSLLFILIPHKFAVHLLYSLFSLPCSLTTSFACCSSSQVRIPPLLLAVQSHLFTGGDVQSSMILDEWMKMVTKKTLIIMYQFCFCTNNVCINFVTI
jgi:hypothetical protein